MGRIVILISVLLLAFHAQCVAACRLLPCEQHVRHSAPAQSTSCHHQEQAPADSHENSSCGHQQLAGMEDVRVAAPDVTMTSLAFATQITVVEPDLSSLSDVAPPSAPPPVASSAASRAILRI